MILIRLCPFILGILQQQKSCNQTSYYIFLVEITSIFANKWQNIGGRGASVGFFVFCFFLPFTTNCFFSLWFLSPIIQLQWWTCDFFSFFFFFPFIRCVRLTDSGTQSVNNKDRRQKLINAKLIHCCIYIVLLYTFVIT